MYVSLGLTDPFSCDIFSHTKLSYPIKHDVLKSKLSIHNYIEAMVLYND